MSDTASSRRPIEPSSVTHAPNGSSIGSSATDRAVVRQSEDDQQTIITHRPPLAAPATGNDVQAELTKLAVGDRLGHFELIAYVGGGGMGRVFRALDTQLSRTVALKVLPHDQVADSETLLRFRNEGRSAARLDHENIARVQYVGEDRGLPYIVFEYVEGIDIRKLVERNGPLPLGEAVSYTLQVADALSHAADCGVVHRDIKPSNVLVTPEGRVKVIDMGLARLQQGDEAATDLTASGVTLGTFDYISPEQARDPRAVDVRSDIYSLGCTFFYMLTGRPPFPEGTVLQKLLQHQGDEPPSVRQFRPGLPEDVSVVLRKMLAKDRGRRYQDPLELVEHLVALAQRVGLRPVGPGRRVWMAPPERNVTFLQRHLPWIAPIAALVLIVVALDYLWSSSAREDNQLPPSLIGQNEEFVPKLPVPEDVMPIKDKETGSDEPARMPPLPTPTEAAPKPPTSEPPVAAEGTAQKQNGSSTDSRADVPAESPMPTEPADAPPASKPVPAEPAGPNPLVGRAADQAGAALRVEGEQGGISAAESISSGMRVAALDNQGRGELTAAAGLPSGSSEKGPATEPPPKRSGVLAVSADGSGAHEFASLGAAISAAVSGDVIELRYNGRREEKPIALDKSRITVRAGEGFRPIVVFRPVEPDPVKCPRGMFVLTGSRLTMVNVALELDVPRGVPAQRWSLFETGQAEKLRLEQCSLTIRNASEPLSSYHQDVAFFRFRAAPAADVVMRDEPSSAEQPIRLELVDCIARGEAVFVRLEHLQPLDLSWENGLLITGERFLWLTGNGRVPQSGESIQIDLQHLTAITRGGFCRLATGQFAARPLPARMSCADSILTAAAGSPLIEQEGGQSKDEFFAQIAWSGDRNFYQGFDPFWRISYLNSKTPPEQIKFDAWRSHWGPERENLPSQGLIEWQRVPDPAKPLCEHAAADYALGVGTPDNPAAGAASDGRDIGALFDRLPQLPPAPTKTEPPTPPEPGKG